MMVEAQQVCIISRLTLGFASAMLAATAVVEVREAGARRAETREGKARVAEIARETHDAVRIREWEHAAREQTYVRQNETRRPPDGTKFAERAGGRSCVAPMRTHPLEKLAHLSLLCRQRRGAHARSSCFVTPRVPSTSRRRTMSLGACPSLRASREPPPFVSTDTRIGG